MYHLSLSTLKKTELIFQILVTSPTTEWSAFTIPEQRNLTEVQTANMAVRTNTASRNTSLPEMPDFLYAFIS